ncbi:hypothetical protein BGX29_000746 [Mortierella sp. GBA35]|nr:hypothetical protein BGX29_000746 [Mortierella sp. GBA35]
MEGFTHFTHNNGRKVPETDSPQLGHPLSRLLSGGVYSTRLQEHPVQRGQVLKLRNILALKDKKSDQLSFNLTFYEEWAPESMISIVSASAEKAKEIACLPGYWKTILDLCGTAGAVIANIAGALEDELGSDQSSIEAATDNSPSSPISLPSEHLLNQLYGRSSNGRLDGVYDPDRYVILVKSPANPDDLGEQTWSTVSVSRSVDCAVNSKGVFVAFFRIRQYLTPGPFTVPVGVRYDPETHAWSSIRTSPYYGWTSDLWNHKSFFVNKNGVESAVHLLTDEKGLVIRFGVLGEAHNVLQLAGVWKLDESLDKYYPSGLFDGLPWPTLERNRALGLFNKNPFLMDSDRRHMVYANGHLYITRYSSEDSAIFSFPFTDATTPPLSTFQTFFGPKRFYHDYFFAGIRGNSSYLGGIGSYNGTPCELRWKSPVSTPFVVGLTTSEIYQFDAFGRNITAPPKMVDVELPGSYYNPILYRTPTTNSRHEYSMLEIVAIGLGCVFGLFLLVKFRRRVKKARRDREIEDNPFFNTDAPLSGSGTGSQGQAVVMRILRDQIEHTSSNSGERLVETATSASSPATGATTITYDDEIRSLQFSSHPRPNIVLSIDDSDQSHTLPQYTATACEDEIQSLEFSSHPRPNIVTTVGGAEP